MTILANSQDKGVGTVKYLQIIEILDIKIFQSQLINAAMFNLTAFLFYASTKTLYYVRLFIRMTNLNIFIHHGIGSQDFRNIIFLDVLHITKKFTRKFSQPWDTFW